ncbi:hypothetical protein B0H10DRAFT_2438404 [Mycena sp. CBHHK59/15]|nr:hypothetical protein B0H10DRAFT_2438404 [Mycena sp. CBHHK59/15]
MAPCQIFPSLSSAPPLSRNRPRFPPLKYARETIPRRKKTRWKATGKGPRAQALEPGAGTGENLVEALVDFGGKADTRAASTIQRGERVENIVYEDLEVFLRFQ